MSPRKFALPKSQFFKSESNKIFDDSDSLEKIVVANFRYLTTYMNSNVQLDVDSEWKTWTPTLANLAKGNGIEIAKYSLDNKTVHVYYILTFGSTSSVSGDVTISLPVTPHGDYLISPIGQALFTDTGTARFLGVIDAPNSGSNALIRVWGSAATHVNEAVLSSTVPFTWTTNDIFQFQATYETA